MIGPVKVPVRFAALLLAFLVATPLAVLGVTDSTAPTGTFSRWGYDYVTEEILVRSSFSDPESGVVSAVVSCDGGPEGTYPYATTVRVPAVEPAAGGCPGWGSHTLSVRIVNGAGLSTAASFRVTLEPTLRFEYPLPPRTGQPFTIRPVWSDGFTVPAGTVCRWEFRWGNTASLRDNEFDETFGGMLFEGEAADGFCGAWTFTLPWVPVPQFELTFDGPGQQLHSGTWPDRNLIHATVVGTDRRIYQSNLPLAQVLPSTYRPVVGEPVTYTRYLVGGAPSGTGVWVARLGSGEDPIVWEKWTTSSTFTITPPEPGNLFVTWHRELDGFLTNAYYDPPVRYPDTTAPNTSAPVQRFGTGESNTTVPVALSWSGTDSGWGIASYRLERSVDGGAWTKVTLATGSTRSIEQALTYGRAYRYRVRATDKAGNVGAWDYGPTFRPYRKGDSDPNATYSSGWALVTDATAHGGVIHEATTAGRAVRFTFTGRDIAWIGPRAADQGRAKVFVDGVHVATVDTRYDATIPRRILFRRHWSSVGTHTIRIEVAGTAGRPAVGIDGFAILR